uniref:WGS project CAEQ00000000 data, annotated contig 397 n=1 Tax=Trypanosoma congolense (strain IL3000) TaxID=1068625 RepID=F9WFK9_TRYCI|nr:unnamed protein product [Trypanosoma congolense IL3000]
MWCFLRHDRYRSTDNRFFVGCAISAVAVSSVAIRYFLYGSDAFQCCHCERYPQFGGFFLLRCVNNLLARLFPWKFNKDAAAVGNVYESEAVVRQYMEFHFTPSSKSFEPALRSITEAFDFPLRVARKFHEFKPLTSSKEKRALEIGCATGASSFEMSKYFDSVVGVDYSSAFIKMARKIAKSSCDPNAPPIKYKAPVQGDITIERTLALPSGVFPERCRFFRGDAMDLLHVEGKNAPAANEDSASNDDCSGELYRVSAGEQFDAVLVVNLLCRVPNPKKLVDILPQLLLPGGVLVISSPYSWEGPPEARDTWIGGKSAGAMSEDLVKEMLSIHFELLDESNEAFLIRDHVRRYQLGVSHCTVWRCRS